VAASGLYFTVVVWSFEPEVFERPNPVNHGPNRHRKLRTPTLQRVNPEFSTLIDPFHTLTVNRRDLSLDPQPWTFQVKYREPRTNKPNLKS
jgi:hypothetical protein